MPRRNLLTPAERAGLFAFPSTDDELTQHYTFTESEISAIRQRRGNHNRLGFAVQLCYLRYPGFALPTDAVPPAPLLAIVGPQLSIEPDIWPQYASTAKTPPISNYISATIMFLYCIYSQNIFNWGKCYFTL
jgi:hypothetical protein